LASWMTGAAAKAGEAVISKATTGKGAKIERLKFRENMRALGSAGAIRIF
jgi:hypothetical protein